MAGKLLIVGLLFLAIVASVSAVAVAPAHSPTGAAAAAGGPSNDEIGELGDYSGDHDASAPGADVVAAPVGGPVAAGTFASMGPSGEVDGKKGSAAGLEVSVIAVGAAAIATGFFI